MSIKILVVFTPPTTISITPSAPKMTTGDEVEWTINGAKGHELTIELDPLTPKDWVVTGPYPIKETISSGSHVVKRNISDPRHLPMGKGLKLDNANYKLSLQPPVSPLTALSPITATDALVIERGVEPIGEGVWPPPHHHHQDEPNGASPGVAGTPGLSRGEQKPGS
jgi:hypothetical protein